MEEAVQGIQRSSTVSLVSEMEPALSSSMASSTRSGHLLQRYHDRRPPAPIELASIGFVQLSAQDDLSTLPLSKRRRRSISVRLDEVARAPAWPGNKRATLCATGRCYTTAFSSPLHCLLPLAHRPRASFPPPPEGSRPPAPSDESAFVCWNSTPSTPLNPFIHAPDDTAMPASSAR